MQGEGEQRERDSAGAETFFVYPLLRRRFSSSAAPGVDGACQRGVLSGEECGWEKNGEERGDEGRSRVLSAGNGHGLWCTSVETIGEMGRCAGDGIVVSVQWCGRGVSACTEPTVRRASSVHEQRFRRTARRFGWTSVLGEGGTLLGLRCRACSCAERHESVRVCAGTRVPVVACLGGVEREQDRAAARPMGALGGRARLVESGGGQWGLVAQCRPVASSRSLWATTVLSGHAGE
jgi:hypothetical protein